MVTSLDLGRLRYPAGALAGLYSGGGAYIGQRRCGALAGLWYPAGAGTSLDLGAGVCIDTSQRRCALWIWAAGGSANAVAFSRRGWVSSRGGGAGTRAARYLVGSANAVEVSSWHQGGRWLALWIWAAPTSANGVEASSWGGGGALAGSGRAAQSRRLWRAYTVEAGGRPAGAVAVPWRARLVPGRALWIWAPGRRLNPAAGWDIVKRSARRRAKFCGALRLFSFSLSL